MESLSDRERELVALGAAISSNCVPCIEYHIPEAKKAGLSDPQIREAVKLADKVRRVPARKVLQTALSRLDDGREEDPDAAAGGCGCGEPTVSAAGDAPCAA